MRWFRSDLSRIHALVVLAALVNFAIGVAMTLGLLPAEPFRDVHGISGALVLPLLLLLPLFFQKRKNLYAALRSRLLLHRRDFSLKNVPALLAKLVTELMVIAYVMQLATGALIGTGWTYVLFPTFGMRAFHSQFMYILPVLIVLHASMMLLAKRKPRKAGR